jgi:hypothetical protein
MDAGMGERSLSKVAEQRAGYDSSADGLAELAQTRGTTMETLAEAVDLPPAVLAQLDAGETRDAVPAALLARRGAALGMGPSRVAGALAARGRHLTRTNPAGLPPGVGTAATFRELIAMHPSMTPEQRVPPHPLLGAEDM